VRAARPLATALAALALAAGPGTAPAADLILHNGRVLVADEAFTVAQALAVRDGRVLAVGRDADVLRHATAGTRRIDLKGRTVLPGLIDTHATLFEYALADFRDELERLDPRLRQLRQTRVQAVSVDDALARIGEVVRRAPPGTWVRVQVRPAAVALELWRRTPLEALDRATPDHPVMLTLVGTQRLLNSRALAALRAHYGRLPAELEPDAGGRPTGRARIAIVRMVTQDLVASPEALAHAYRSELAWWAARGVTTWSAPLEPLAPLRVFTELDRRGELPIRFAYSHAMGTAFPQPPAFWARLRETVGRGTPHFWSIGVSTGAIDGAYPRVCTTIPAAPAVKALEECRAAPGTFMRGVLHDIVRSGLRLSGVHAAGDGAVDHFLDAVERASREAGLSLEEVRRRRHAIDHCWMSPRPDQVARARRLGVLWSCSPVFLLDAERIARDYGERYAHERVVPVRRILEAGGRVAMETDDDDLPRRGAFWHIEALVTRRDRQGRVWGADQAVDRRTALLMFTRWAAEYVLREDVLGSLEPGKWADFVVIDRDYLTVPDDELSEIGVLLTAVGGRPVYTDPSFARETGLPAVGARPPAPGAWDRLRGLARRLLDRVWPAGDADERGARE